MNIHNVLRNYEHWVKNNYNMEDPKILDEYEYFHNVLDVSTFLAKEMNLSEEDTFIAQTLAIVHHCAIFRKINFGLTFGAHSKEGSLLLQQSLLKLFLQDTRAFDFIITESVFYHHCTKLEEKTSPIIIIHSKLLQLAIKLSMLSKYISNLEKNTRDNSSIPLRLTPEVRQALKTSTPFSFLHVLNDLDMLAFELRIINNDTPKAALKLVKSKGYVERLTKIFLERYPLCGKNDIELIRQTANTVLEQV